MIQFFPGRTDLLDALGNVGRIDVKVDQVFGGDAKLLPSLTGTPAPPAAQFADARGAGLQPFLDRRHLSPTQADVVFDLVAHLFLQLGGLLQFTILDRRFELAHSVLDVLPFLIAMLNLSLLAGAQFVE